MKKNVLFCAVIAIFLALPVSYAHPDIAPEIDIVGYDGRGFVADEVDTDVDIVINAEDDDFNAGISSLQLFENGRFLQRKECFFTIECELRVHIHHDGAGARRYVGVVIDAGGNRKTASVSVSFLGRNRPPEIGFPKDLEVQENTRLVVEIRTGDFDNDIVVLTASNLPRGATFENDVFTWTPDFGQSGTYRISFTASDDDGSTTRIMNVRVINRNREPTVNFSQERGRIVMNEDDDRKFTATIADPDRKRPTVQWKLDGRTVSTSKTYNYHAGFRSAGVHEIEATVTDGNFATTEKWVVDVRDKNREPDIRQIDERNVEEGEKVRIRLSAKDVDGDPLEIEARHLPGGATFDAETNIFEWKTKEGDRGIYSVTFRVDDGKGGSDAETVRIRISQEFRTSHERYHDLLDRLREERRNQTRTPTARNQTSPISLAPLPTTQESCRPGYLCSSTSYFFR